MSLSFMRSDARTRLYVFSVVPKNAMWQSPMSSLLNGRVLWPLRLSGCTSVANHSSLVCVGAGRGHTKLLRGGTTLVQVRGSICGIISRIELRPPPLIQSCRSSSSTLDVLVVFPGMAHLPHKLVSHAQKVRTLYRKAYRAVGGLYVEGNR